MNQSGHHKEMNKTSTQNKDDYNYIKSLQRNDRIKKWSLMLLLLIIIIIVFFALSIFNIGREYR